MERKYPLTKRDFRSFKDCPDRHSEVLAALVALIEAIAMRLTLELVKVLCGLAMRADRPVRPQKLLKVLPRRFFVFEDRVVEVCKHWVSPAIGRESHVWAAMSSI